MYVFVVWQVGMYRGGQNKEHATFGMAKFGAEKIWHPFLDTIAKFGINSRIVAQKQA